MRQTILSAAIVAIAILPCAAQAAHRVPGQWETTTRMHFVQGGIQIPPEVQAQMKARGIKMPTFGEPHTYKHCLTVEEAARDEHPDFSQDKSCTSQNARWSGNHFHADITCSGNSGTRHGVVDGDIGSGGKSYAGTFRMEGDDPHMGGHFVMQGQSSGKWLGPSCARDAS
ncbi:MAG TPA: DUF3617 domain-containing protein [Rhodanobacteraceae bacterium]|nr:DUF3617 domain-containing protein [Rhodanobacteraceae bacterium]